MSQNKVLNKEDLIGSIGSPVWIEYINNLKHWYNSEYGMYSVEEEAYATVQDGKCIKINCPLSYYGQTWVAYTQKPLI